MLVDPKHQHGTITDFMKRPRTSSANQRLIWTKPPKTEQKPIEIIPFQGIGTISPVNPADYTCVPDEIRKVLRPMPSRNVERAVVCVMINMLSGLSNGICEPGKKYSHEERMYLRKQARALSQSMSSLEVIFGEEAWDVGTIGGFKKDRYEIRDLREYIEDNLGAQTGDYHIVYIDGTVSEVYLDFETDDIGNIVVGNLRQKYKQELSDFYGYFSSNADILESIETKLGKNPLVISLPEDEIERAIAFSTILKEYLGTPDGLTENERTFLTTAIEKSRPFDNFRQTTQDEKDRVLTDIGINPGALVARIAGNTAPNGILMLGSLKVNVPGFSLIADYKSVSLYQRR